ncbi:uncharacterized protein LOC131020002 [Salvia miltiorrhiza]|uniref:uncharacterized protein LOC131020002 n=1 Tax=Salvia miltiorrhiza TaxID=226208 RepID=UPI0025AD8967|nr:uncharacterized protein LOC131020002 [Salvia miltiorrhiza]
MKSPNFSPSSESCPSSSSAQIVAALLQLPAASPPYAALKLRQSRRRAPECLSLSIPVHNRARLLANGARPSLFPRGSPPRIAPARPAVAASEIGDASAVPCSTSHILTHAHPTEARVVPSPPITNRRDAASSPVVSAAVRYCFRLSHRQRVVSRGSIYWMAQLGECYCRNCFREMEWVPW